MSVMIHVGDCREVLAGLPNESVHCVVTSPPYWGLRDYGTGAWECGDPDCDHRGAPLASSSSSLAGYTSEDVKIRTHTMPFRHACPKCGALRIDNQVGVEATPDEYVANMLAVFREVRRVLRKDGTLWLNLGDSYAAEKSGRGEATHQSGNIGGGEWKADPDHLAPTPRKPPPGFKPKDLVGIPWSVAFALRADGWWLRQDIIWAKPNPMPESVRDRCTKAHEYVFLLAKSERYYYDAEAIAEPTIAPRTRSDHMATARGKADPDGSWMDGIACAGAGTSRNRRTVWTIATQAFSEAHFAAFPPKLIEPCILAGCPEGGTVLDPFGGAGTTGLVADRLGRNAILIELNQEYAEMARERIRNDAPLFAHVEIAP